MSCGIQWNGVNHKRFNNLVMLSNFLKELLNNGVDIKSIYIGIDY